MCATAWNEVRQSFVAVHLADIVIYLYLYLVARRHHHHRRSHPFPATSIQSDLSHDSQFAFNLYILCDTDNDSDAGASSDGDDDDDDLCDSLNDYDSLRPLESRVHYAKRNRIFISKWHTFFFLCSCWCCYCCFRCLRLAFGERRALDALCW